MRPRRRRVVVALGSAAIATLIGVACSFPEVTFFPVGAEGGNGSETGTGEGGLTDGPGIIDGPDLDAVVSDAGQKTDALACAADACDCDDDGFFDKKKPFCLVDGSPGDCDDNDSRYRPNQGLNYEPEEPPLNGDWNCNGTVETVYPYNITCKGTAPTATECDTKYGFTDKPPCGATGGRYVECATVCGIPILGCECREKGPPDITKRQACK